MKEVTYQTPDGERQLEVFEEVIAYDTTTMSDPSASDRVLGRNAIERGRPYQSNGYEEECTMAMQKAGWYFAEARPEMFNAYLGQALPGGCKLAGTLCRDSDQQLKIALPHLDVKLASDLSNEDAIKRLNELGYQILHSYNCSGNMFLVRIPPGRDVFDHAHTCSKDGLFEFAEPEYLEHLQERSLVRDEFFGYQWHLNKIGAPAAWDEGVRGQSTNIALIDSGFDLTHPDLEPALSPITGFFDRMGNLDIERASFPREHLYHGTFCAGIACARLNDIAVVGVAPEASLSCLLPTMGNMTRQGTLARAILFAANPERESSVRHAFARGQGADVISCSIGPSTSSDWVMRSVLREAIDEAWQQGRSGLGVPVFWAVANVDRPIRGTFHGDQVVAHNNTIAVGSSDSEDMVDRESAFGSELDFVAPGVRVVSASNRTEERAEELSGASYAAPCAAGCASLVLTANPDLTAGEVRQVLRDSCDKVGPDDYFSTDAGTRNDRYGFGRVNAERAVGLAKRLVSS